MLSGILFSAAYLHSGTWEDALSAKAGGDYPRSIDLLREIVSREPNNIGARFQLGTVLGWSGRFEESVSTFETALKIAPANLELRLGYGRALAWAGHLEHAEELMRGVLTDDPGNIDAWVMLGRLRSWRKDYDAADAAYRDALLRDPRSIDALVGLGDVMRWQERFPEALAYYRQAGQLDPKSAELRNKIRALDGLGRWRLDTGLDFSSFSGDSRADWYGWDASLRYSLDRRTGISAGVEWARRFGLEDTQYHVGADHRFGDRVSSYGQLSLTPQADFLSRRSLTAGLAWKAHDATVGWPTFVLLGDLRLSTYGSRTAQTYWFGGTQYLPHRLAVTVKGSTTRNLNDHRTRGWQLRLEGDPSDVMHWYLGYSDGRESLSSTIYDFTRELRTRAVIAGIYYEFSPGFGVRFDCAREWSYQSPNQFGSHVGMVKRF